MKTKKTAAKKLTIGLDLGDRRHHACVLDAAGEIVSSSIKAMAFTRKVWAQLAPEDCALVEPLLAAVDAVNGQIKQLDVELETLAQARYPVTERLRQVPGVGPLTALCFVLTLGSGKGSCHDFRPSALLRAGRNDRLSVRVIFPCRESWHGPLVWACRRVARNGQDLGRLTRGIEVSRWKLDPFRSAWYKGAQGTSYTSTSTMPLVPRAPSTCIE